MADVTGERSRAQLLLVGALALAVIFLSLSLLLNSVIYTENLATRQTHADVEKAETFRASVVDGLGGAVEYANRRNVTGFADRRDAYRAATDDWIPTLANYSATDGLAGDVDRAGVQQGTRIVDANASTGIVDRNGDGDWTMATDSSVRRFRLNVTLSSVDSPDDTTITIDDGTAQDVVVEDDGSGPQVRVVGRGTCELTRGHVDIGAGRVDGDYCPPLADARPTGTVDVSVSNGDGIDATYSFVVDRHSEGFRTAVDTANFPGQCTPPSPPTYATTVGDDPYTTPAIYAATARIGVATQDLDYRRTVRAAPDEAGEPATGPTFTTFNVTQSGNDFDVGWQTSDPNADVDSVDLRVTYVTNGTVYADSSGLSPNGSASFKDVPSGLAYYVNGTVTDGTSDRRVSEIHDTGACPP
ncbi:hypothetical protein DU500_08950 [Haloplanus rubicundus]|uniref:Uncharacterized protein n=1 Tax=Haloplanus rubicundus TaxID=1547898 RepID=A0A345ECN6_9EURY|nr:hypothetical protein [Haloplanus rubicundus]AXG06540.1 hypothetical protein DU500_08950 [Haloplanus rubicundus]AXG09958.1 hypothetical protein DU484_08910 [Haloplanus rubicundus]